VSAAADGVGDGLNVGRNISRVVRPERLGFAVQETGVDLAGLKAGMREDFDQKRDIRPDAQDRKVA
jgi:hypothetical protein